MRPQDADNNKRGANVAAVVDEKSRLEALLTRVDGMAVLPHVVFKVLEISGSEISPASQMERAIIVDPGFSSKVLSLANSTAFGLNKKVVSIREAVMFLGFRQVRNLAMTIGSFDLFVGKNDRESLRRRAWWRQSIDSAVASQFIAKRTGKATPDEAYTCGLLHLIGKTLLDRFGDKRYELVDKLVLMGASERQAERVVYGCDHIQVAMGACERWGLPPVLLSGLRYLDRPTADSEQPSLRACTALGSNLALRARSGSINEPPAWAFQVLKVDPPNELIEATIEAVVQAQLQI